MTQWEKNAHTVETVYGGYVDWEERFYECIECGEPIYEDDWDSTELMMRLCPVCEFEGDEVENDETEWLRTHNTFVNLYPGV